MNYASLKKYDVANAPGICTTLFVSGCTHHCEGCFNQDQWNFNYGNRFTAETLKELLSYANDNAVANICILGGDPLDQGQDMLNMLLAIKSNVNKPIWLWTGYTFEEILIDNLKTRIIEHVDVLVDGKFILEQRDLKLKYKGSKNQRVIDVKSSLESGKVVLLDVN